MTFTLGLLTGFILGIVALWVFLEIVALRLKHEQIKQPEQIPEQIRGSGQIREADLWDVGQAAERGVNYSFMGLTGIEKE
jgi:hypothetical protein